MYSIIDLQYLDFFVNNKIDDINNKKKYISSLFEIENIIRPCSQTNCISICLFCQNVDNKEVRIECSDNYLNKSSKWYTKYYKSLINFIKKFNESKYYNEFKIRIYLENQLSNLIDDLLLQSEHIEIYYMKQNSIGAQPGMLWRFLVFDDKNLDVVLSSDIDIDFESVNNKLDTFKKSNKTFGRLLPWCLDDFIIDESKSINSPLNYAACIGSSIAIRPKSLDINIKNIIINYILYRINRYISIKPWEEFDNQNTEKYNKPIGGHIYGWGGYWTMYGFDEKIWKHTIFPYLVKKSQVLSWTNKDNIKNILSLSDNNHPSKIDYNFITLHNNEFAYI
jgi:hypothetical protein